MILKTNKPKYTQIIDAAVNVIAENGYHASQVSKIAKKAGVADGTIYLYFKNKEDILVSLFQEKMGIFIEKIEKEINDVDDAEKKLGILIKMHFNQLAENHDLAIVTQLELRQSNIALRLKINEILKKYLKIIDEIIDAGINQGVFRKELNPRLARQMIFGTIDEIATNWVMKDQKYNVVKQADEVHELIIQGLSSNVD
ncbi:TetR/AcrR family fatty acid metabolism transcriptional regulator [Aquibacillus albus]|uniref:TetR/AcrR family fatty acid metabolism transcriptional regulator n=1 Tax=Aquibacillus albus TaxID=1168171 RepID=A0ABS2N1L0_9BACI|nr:TetR/AcrR family fatty acid metabolism transcriptional regulator [Aquibacillus albus]